MVTAERKPLEWWPLLIGAASAAAVFAPWWTAGLLLAVPLAWWTFSGRARWIAVFFAAALLLPPLPIPLGDTGPHPAMLIAALGLLSGAARLDQWNLRWTAVDAAFSALLLALTLSLGFAAVYSGPAIAAASTARVALFAIGVFVYFSAAHGPARHADWTRLLYALAAAAALFGCIDFLFQLPAPAGFEPQFLWLDSGVYRRAQGFFYEASTLGNFAAFFLVGSAAAVAEPPGRRPASLPLLCFGALTFAAALLLSFSRASVLACLISLTALAVLERQRWFSRRSVIWIAACVAASAIAFSIAVPEVAEGYWGRLQLTLARAQDSPDLVLSGRLTSWSTVLGFIEDHPWQTLLGIGYKTLPYTEHLGRPVIADNMYLSLLVETGVFGLLALIALNLTSLAAAWRAHRAGSFHGRWLFCFWIGESLQMLSGDLLTYWRVLPVYFWVLAMAVRAGRREADARIAD